MQIKKTCALFVILAQINLQAQTDLTGENLYRLGMAHLQGVAKTYDPQVAKSLFNEASKKGYAPAMNQLGNMYAFGTGTRRNLDSAIFWYKKSIAAGNKDACYSLGNMYKIEGGISQDFQEAFTYFSMGSDMSSLQCKKMVAYMCYKGFGTNQDYNKAFTLFKELAENGNKNAMYFLGLCYRNGYGTGVNSELASQWLQKAALNERQATRELGEDAPENVGVISPQIQYELNKLKGGFENFKAANTNNYQGVYNGYAIYYDWSGKFVTEIQPLLLDLKKEVNSYIGFWKEGNAEATPIKMNSNNNNFKFNNGCSYTRNNHYSGRKPETWHFNEANLNLAFNNDSILLSGFVQFYSKERREPGKPLQIILKKAIDKNAYQESAVNLSLYPNPATNQTTVQFSLSNASRIVFQVYAQNGTLVYTDKEKLLPPGTYTYNLPIGKLIAGTYNIQLIVDGKAKAAKTLVKQ